MERSELLARFASAPGRMASAAAAAAAPTDPDEWSAVEVLGHLVSVEPLVWQARLDSLTASDDEPSWSWTEPGVSDSPEAATLDGALRLFAALRAATVARVAALDDAGWARTGLHATYGRLDVAGLIGIAADHDDDHLAYLESLAAG
jgi:DinB superfamily